ncbi:hypothetical protein RMATCC62417_16259 [Rhizopus microsporus]|nr:hypothetical protein RMATCC62417_16259 [Rhizopus microsporus]
MLHYQSSKNRKQKCFFFPFQQLCLLNAFFFPVDLMHLFGSNIGPQIANMITTDTFIVNKQSQHPLRLRNKDIQQINSLLRECLLTLTIFSSVIENIESGYSRSVDWIHFLRYSLPTTTVVGCYLDKRIQQRIMYISRMANLACQREIKKNDVAAILEWSSWLKELIDTGKLQPWIFNISQYLLLHIPGLVLYLGPIPSYAAFSIERTIQEYKSRMESRKDPATNCENVLLEPASLHWAERMAIAEGKEKSGEVLLDDDEESEYEGLRAH